MKSLGKKYRLYFGDKSFLISVAASFALLLLSLVANFYAGIYATERASNSVTDLVLNNIPVFDVEGIEVLLDWRN